ncbi:hypothetical protein KBA41_10705 [Candidatus Ozemobacteraceae bacterium]|nr:hypothetical protein [Candidatus Ozemobacteraceae bacterium]
MDNQRVAILVLVISICLCTLLFFFFRSHASRAHRGLETGKKPTRETGEKRPSTKGTTPIGTTSHPGSPHTGSNQPASSGSPGDLTTVGKSHGNGGTTPFDTTSAPPVMPSVTLTPDTKAQLEEMAAEIRAHRREVTQASEKWLRSKLEDTSLTEKTREIYRLRLLPDMNTGVTLLESKDYQGALRAFEKALDDPDASPVSKHFIYDYMLQAAAKLKNKMLYGNLYKQQAMLQRDHDLSVIGFNKSGDAFAYAEYLNEHLIAADDEATFNRIVERDMKSFGATSSADREACVADLKQRIRKYEGYFDDNKN